jgi:hypothetical protein
MQIYDRVWLNLSAEKRNPELRNRSGYITHVSPLGVIVVFPGLGLYRFKREELFLSS